MLKFNDYGEWEEQLSKEIVGQPEAVRELAKLYVLLKQGVRSDGPPLRSLFLAGPSGVGKTESVFSLARLLSDGYLPNPLTKVMKVDGGNFHNGHEVASLIGSPHGYLGFGSSKGRFDPESLASYYINFKDWAGKERRVLLVLVDEAEKGHESLHNAFLSILDKGQLTLGDNTISFFNEAIIFFTSNSGNREMLGSNPGFIERERNFKASFFKEYEKAFRPEYRGRIDQTVVYRALSKEVMEEVARINLQKVSISLFDNSLKVRLKFAEGGEHRLIDSLKREEEGARALVKILKGELRDRILTIQGLGSRSFSVIVDYQEGEFVLSEEKSLFRSA